MILLNVCLSDIPKENITTGKNGKEFTFQKREEQAPTRTVQQPKQAESSDPFSDTDDLPF